MFPLVPLDVHGWQRTVGPDSWLWRGRGTSHPIAPPMKIAKTEHGFTAAVDRDALHKHPDLTAYTGAWVPLCGSIGAFSAPQPPVASFEDAVRVLRRFLARWQALPPPIGWWDVETAGGPPSETTWRWEARGPASFQNFANNDVSMLVEFAIHTFIDPKGESYDLYTGVKKFGAPTMEFYDRYGHINKGTVLESPELAMRAAYHVWVQNKATFGPPDEKDRWAAWRHAVKADPMKRWPWMEPVWPSPSAKTLAHELGWDW